MTTIVPSGRRRRLLVVATTAVLVGVAAVAAGSSRAAGGYPTAPATKKLQRGGTITVLSAGDVDHIDPGQAYYSFTYEVTYATQRPLLAFRPKSVQQYPDLAAAMPNVSSDGRTVTVHIKKGVRFSPPVNRAVTSADVNAYLKEIGL